MTTRRWQLSGNDDASVAFEVAAVLEDSGVVALPTETFYGLAASSRRHAGLARIASLKHRPASMPLLLLVDGIERAQGLVGAMPPLAVKLMERFWPGPLTLVLPAAPGLLPALLGADSTVAVRHSSHPFPNAVVDALDAAITGTSANLSGASPPRIAARVELAPGEHLDGIVDGGETAGGPPSTLLQIVNGRGRVLRAGAISAEALRQVLGDRLL